MTREKLGNYDIVGELGRGGMGVVYDGKTPEGERVAIKTMIVPPDLDSRSRWDMVDRFMMEARAIRALEHRNIVSVLDTGEDQGEFYIVMEFLDGKSIRQVLDSSGPFAPRRATDIIADVCAALKYAHQKEVIHRDIKPDNIIILKNGITKLTDFGLARVGEVGSNTQVGTMLGTFAYMSPEQARGEKLDARSDIFSLGITLYEMLSGRRPFGGESTASVLSAILMKEPEPIPNAPAELQAVLDRCLAKDPRQRFQSAEEMLRALEPPQEGTVVGRPVIVAAPAPGTVPSSPGGPAYDPAPAPHAPPAYSPPSQPPSGQGYGGGAVDWNAGQAVGPAPTSGAAGPAPAVRSYPPAASPQPTSAPPSGANASYPPGYGQPTPSYPPSGYMPPANAPQAPHAFSSPAASGASWGKPPAASGAGVPAKAPPRPASSLKHAAKKDDGFMGLFFTLMKISTAVAILILVGALTGVLGGRKTATPGGKPAPPKKQPAKSQPAKPRPPRPG